MPQATGQAVVICPGGGYGAICFDHEGLQVARWFNTQGVTANYQIIVDRVNNLDTLEVRVEMGEHLFADEIGKLQTLERTLQKNIKEYLGVTVKVRLMEPHSIERSEGKAKRIVDNRPKD